MGIPELSINPLSQRLVALFENTNFQDFVRKVSLFSDKAPFEEKLRFMFTVWDVDGDGRISLEDLEHVLRQRAGSSLSEIDLRAVAQRVLREAGVEAGGGMGLDQFREVFKGDGLTGMRIDPPELTRGGVTISPSGFTRDLPTSGDPLEAPGNSSAFDMAPEPPN